MSKLTPIKKYHGDTVVGYMFYCPGCKNHHAVHIRPHKAENGASWEFNLDLEKPTFSPSILSRVESPYGKTMICHSFVVSGEIRFLSDCTHAFAGKTVAMEEDI